MVRRRHGWQLPAHPFQVVAITVFFLLAVAFYVFLAPFLWFQVLEITALALYSPLALAVFLLYVRCSAIDPADRGVFQPQSKDAEKGPYSEGTTHGDALHPFSPGLSTPSRSPSVMPPDKKRESKAPYVEQSAVGWSLNQIQMLPAAFCGLFCGWLVKPDHCRDDSNLQQPLAEEEVLFCTLCNAEVRKLSKHCRSCDKCVDGFDHHCRWLNNCVGRKNYSTFVSLMATSLSLLVLEWGIGMAVFVRCFADRRGIEHQIVDKLGNGFSRGPFATVVAIFTLVALLASVPLGELFFFHLILIRKGITTYEYVVAMRVQNEQQGLAEGDVSGFPTSPSSSSVTALSNSSSVGLQYSRGGWCTPPRIFVDQQDEVLGAGRLPSTVDPDAGNMASRYNTQHRKGVVRISAWKLAKLNTDEARRAGAKAREASSILRQLEPRGPLAGDSEYTSSNNISRSSSVSGDYSSRKQRLRDNSTDASLNAQDLPTYTVEDYSSIQRERLEVGNQSRSSGGSPSHTVNVPTLSPLPGEGRYGLSFPNTGLHSRATLPADSMVAIPREVAGDSQVRADVPAHHVTVMSLSSAEFSRIGSGPPVSSDGYEASSGESADDIAFPSRSHFASRDRVFTDHVALPIEEERKMSLIGDRPSGGNVLPEENRATTNPLYNTPGYRYQWVDPSASASSLSNDRPSSDYVPERFFPSQRSMMAEASPSLHGSSLGLDNLVYSGTSIFYGGPMEYPLDKP